MLSTDARAMLNEWKRYSTGSIEVSYPLLYFLDIHHCYRCEAQTGLMLVTVGEHKDEWICGRCLDTALRGK